MLKLVFSMFNTLYLFHTSAHPCLLLLKDFKKTKSWDPESEVRPDLHPPSAQHRWDGIAFRGKNPLFSCHFPLISTLTFPDCALKRPLLQRHHEPYLKKWIQLHKMVFVEPKRHEYKELMGMRAFRPTLICIGKLHSKLFPGNVAATITGKHDDSFCNANERLFFCYWTPQ